MRSEQDGATVKLVYENRGEKLGLAKLDLSDKIAAGVDAAEFDVDQTALLERSLGKDYEVITADERLDKDRATVEDTFMQLIDLANSLNAEQQRSVAEGLSEDQLALFDLVTRTDLSHAQREKIKQASRDLLAGVLRVIALVYRHIWQQGMQNQLPRRSV